MAVPRLGDRPGSRSTRRPSDRPSRTAAAVVWLCSPNNPTALAEPRRRHRGAARGPRRDAAAAGREPPIVVLDEAYAEFVGTSLVGLRADYPNLIVVRTASKAYALAGLRVGFAHRAARDDRPARPRIGRRAPSRPCR